MHTHTDRFRVHCRRCGNAFDALTCTAPARYCSDDCANEPLESGRHESLLFCGRTLLAVVAAGFLLGLLAGAITRGW